MSRERYFFQDFLFEDMPVDEQDNPVVEVAVSPDNNAIGYMVVSFDKMLRIECLKMKAIKEPSERIRT